MANNRLNTLIKSGNLPLAERKIVFIGVVSATIFSRSIFKDNNQLRPYIKYFEEEFNVVNLRTKEPGFADYVYGSRPLLCSRISNYLFKLDDLNKFNKLINNHFDYLNDSQKKSEKETKQRKKSSILADMELSDEQ